MSDHRAAPSHDAVHPRMRPHMASVFGLMSARANRLGAINLGQGFPDEDGPQELKDVAVRAITDGSGNQYPPVHGSVALRSAIAAHHERFYGVATDPDSQVVVTTGASEAIAAAVLALVRPGDEVAMFDPWFDLYPADVALAGGRRVTVPLRGPDLRPDADALAAALTPATRVLIVNSPHNPTGIVFTAEETAAIAEVAVAHDLIVISDEAYEHLWFDGHRPVPIATLPGMAERTVTIGSGGKSFSFTGWKVGWATGPADLVHAIRVVRQHLSFVSGGPFQAAIATGLALPDDYFAGFRRRLAARRDLLADGLAALGMRVLPTQGTYFIAADVSGLGMGSGAEFCEWSLTSAGVAAIPMSALSDHHDADAFVRWAFCKRPETLREALRRLAAALPAPSTAPGAPPDP